MIGGSVSNLIDRVRLGHVTDFLDLRYWPAFNLADSFIVLGVIILLRRARSSPTASRAAARLPTLRLLVPDDAAGARLDRFLAELPEVGSRAAAERLLAAGARPVDGEARAKSYRLEGGEEVEVEMPRARAEELEPEEVELAVAYEDEHLLVVDKPAGRRRPSGRRVTRAGTLVHGCSRAGSRAATPDRPGNRPPARPRHVGPARRRALATRRTSALQSLVRRRALEREYLALVRGHPRSRRGRIEAPIGRDRHEPTRHSLDTATPREAVTHFEVDRLLGERRAPARSPRDRQDAPDQRPPGGDRPPCFGDRVYGVPTISSSNGSSCTPRGLPSHTAHGQRIDVVSPLPADLAIGPGQGGRRAFS